jgi:HEPN domain-containing protein
MDSGFDKNKHINYWVESSDRDFKTMLDLYKTKNNSWALFIGHLMIEKLLKALYIKNKGDFPPMIHDLRRIAEKAEVAMDPGNQNILDTISRFNINARYDDLKQSFYQLCTDSFTKEWIEKIEDCRQWIKAKL